MSDNQKFQHTKGAIDAEAGEVVVGDKGEGREEVVEEALVTIFPVHFINNNQMQSKKQYNQ